MEEGYVDVGGVHTRVITFGGWIDNPLTSDKLILVIPGNPGLIGYYETFMHFLHQRTGGGIPVWGLSHGGHEFPLGSPKLIPCIRKNPHLFTLQGQVLHKIAFVEKYVPGNVEVLLIGHSIGAKICVELMKHFDRRNCKSYLLFPTLERMAETPNGRRLWPLLGPVRRPVVMAAHLLNFLPRTWLSRVVQWFLGVGRAQPLAIEGLGRSSGSTSIPSHHVRTTLHLLQPAALERSLFMAHDELRVVRDLDVEELKTLAPRLRLYFGVGDKWCPEHHYHELKKAIPDIRATLCPHGIEHAFVLQSSEHMAHVVAEWLGQD